MGKMKLDGFGIFVKDMPTMVKFYRDVLGFEIKEDENTTNALLEKDGTLFMLYRRTDFEKMTDTRFNYAENINGHYEVAGSSNILPDAALKNSNILNGIEELVFSDGKVDITLTLAE